MENDHGFTDRIIIDIHNIMQRKDIDAFDIVPVESNVLNKSPVLHHEGWLGLESWCVKHVYMFCYSEVMDNYVSKSKRKPLKVTSISSERLTRLLNITLLLNPELTTLWNMRRNMVLKLLLDKQSELVFTKLVLSRKAKSNDAFAYRRWLLECILQDDNLQTNCIENIVTEELYVCEQASDKKCNNYHSWNHRIWFTNELRTVEKKIDLDLFFMKEYEFSERWTSKHVSDYSCFHYRQFCIKNLYKIDNKKWKSCENVSNMNLRKSFVKILALHFPKDCTVHVSEKDLLMYTEVNLVNLLFSHSHKNCNCSVDKLLICRKLEILFHEIVLNNELLRFYKQHETLWYHRRFILHEILVIMYTYYGLVRQNGSLVKNKCRNCNLDSVNEKQSKIGRYDCNGIYLSILFNILLSHENMFVNERRNDSDMYADRHESYMKFVEDLKNVM